jgi:hypothetical protein
MAESGKGHVFDFDAEKCARCGMTRAQFDDRGEPPCIGRPVVPEVDEPDGHHEFARPDDE